VIIIGIRVEETICFADCAEWKSDDVENENKGKCDDPPKGF
jgi:hypothetical protein